MKESVVERELFPKCTVAALLDRVGQGVEWDVFFDYAFKNSLITWAFTATAYSAVVGHKTSLAPLQKHIATFARNSYGLSDPAVIRDNILKNSGQASAQIKKQCSSADQYAFITLHAEPRSCSRSIQLTIPQSDDIPAELHEPGLPEAILDGICVAALDQCAEPIVGFRVTVIDAKWHDVDSYAGVFTKTSCLAMSEIFRNASVSNDHPE